MQALISSHGFALILMGLLSIVLLVVLIARYKIGPFLVLMSVSLALALVAGMPAKNIVKSFEAGVGGILGHIAIIVALGTILGKMMAESGGAERIALTLIDAFGEKNVHWAMMVIALIVGLPVFFEVGFVLLVPIAFNVAKRTNKSMVFVGLPMVAGLSVVHGLVPPHPAALLAVAAFHADIGRTIVYALLVGIPAAIVAGPLYAKFISPRIPVSDFNPIADQLVEEAAERRLPGFAASFGTILFPVALMMIAGWANDFFRPGSFADRALLFLGDPDISLLAAVFLSFIVLGRMRGFSRETILKFSNDCLAPTATITLLIGAGGGFSQILQDTGISGAIVQFALHSHVSFLLLAWLLAAVVRLATGSSTVAMATAAGIVAPIALNGGVRPELLALATGAGSLVFSHVNDGGFWLVKEYYNLSVTDTMKSWSICETIISFIALFLTLVLSHIL